MKNAALLAPVLLLAACAPPGKPVEATASVAAPAPLSPYGFDVELAFTLRAVDQLKAGNEKVAIEITYFGAPTSEDAAGRDDHVDLVSLGSDRVEIAPGETHARAPGTGFDPAKLPGVKGDPEVLVNVFSARKTNPDNVLDCDIYQGPIAMARKKPVQIHCDLIQIFPEPSDENKIPNPLEQ